MSAAAAIATVGPAICGQFITTKVFDASATMTAAAVYPYLIYKVAFLHISRQKSVQVRG